MNFRSKLQYWFPVILWIGFIFWMSTGVFSAQNTFIYFEPILRFFAPSISHREIMYLHTVLRKVAHLTEYFISGLLIFRAFRNGSHKRKEWSWALSSLFVVILIAASDEFHQSYVAARTASLVDVGIDVFGGLLAQSISVFIFQRRHQ
jgi:VanZ family protein